VTRPGRRAALSGALAALGLAGPARAIDFAAQQDKVNAWTVGLAAGLVEGAPLRLASEMARVADDGADLQVLPIVTRGPTDNLNALLYLRGVDLAIINADSLEEYRLQLPEIRQHVVYLLNLFPSELHVFARPEIARLQDLAGRKVNFNTLGSAAAYSGPLVFSRLDIAVDRTFVPHPLALQQLRRGEIAAVVFLSSKPVDAFQRATGDEGYRLLPVAYDNRFEDCYLPATLEAPDYPALIRPGERIETLAVPTALVSYNWPVGSNRYQRVARFTERLFDRIERLQVPGFDPKWQTVNLGASVPGLPRFAAAEQWLERQGRLTARRQ
jgi:TRAP-type uncharacterized transport system substrate-binding protein